MLNPQRIDLLLYSISKNKEEEKLTNLNITSKFKKTTTILIFTFMIHPRSHDHYGIRERSKQQWTKDRCGKWSAARGEERERENSLRSCSRNAEDTEDRAVCFSKRGGGTDEKSTGRINSKMNLVKVKVLNEVRYQCSPLSPLPPPLAKCAAATLFSRSKG